MICNRCKQEKDTSNFRRYVYKNKEYLRKTCFSCKMEQQNIRRNKLREFVNTYKLSCIRCGFSDYRALQFHHKDDNKEINIADATRNGWSVNHLRDEIEKCEVICANCHSIEHYREVP